MLQALHNHSQALDIRNAIAYVDFKTQLVDEFLFFTDRLSMAHSLEARVAYLDHEFVELDYRSVNNISQWLIFMLCSQGKIYEGGDKHEETTAFESCHGCAGKVD
jgi:hypothetical protein